MDWTKTMTQKDLARFLASKGRELAEDVIYFAPAFVRSFCEEHEDELTAFVKRWQYELEGDYCDLV